jgi:uracil-DNA glycosylase family 4
MKGFFPQQVVKPVRAKGSSKLSGCSACGLDKTCITPKMKVTGEGARHVLIIAEAPGKTEDERGKQLIGEAGQLLRSVLREIDVDLDADCWKTNAIICRPPKNRTPSAREIKECRHNLFGTITALKPDKIILLGRVAVESYFGEVESIGNMERWTGWKIPDRRTSAWVFPTYHPSYLLRDERNDALRDLFKRHLREAFSFDTSKSVIASIWQAQIDILRTEEEAVWYLRRLVHCPPDALAFDYETNGLRPYHEGSKIVCMSIATGDRAVAFPMFDGADFRKLIRRVLQGSAGKIAQNIKFEATWTREWLGYPVKNWRWDTMLAQHVIDNRAGITGLKFQSFVRYGVMGYEDEVAPYLVAKDGPFNRVDEVPIENLLMYCGMDSALTFQLYKDQQSEVGAGIAPGNNLLLAGAEELSVVEGNGIAVDVEYFKRQRDHLDRRVEKLNAEILASDEATLWKKQTGEELNPGSDKQLKELLFDMLKIKSKKDTAKGNPSVDQETLEGIDREFCRKIVQMRKLKKISGTYIGNYIEGAIDGRLYPFFNLNRVKTYRSSSDSPNFQNIPVRDAEAQKIIRTGIKPSAGNQLLEVDYSGVEVRIGACYHKDPEMLRYINDPTTDMHRDMAVKIFQEDEAYIKKHKHLRQAAKNGFVFPQFYGDYYINCAANIWNGHIKADDKTRLKGKGIGTLHQFENHLKKIEDDFWYKKFTGYTGWKQQTWREYQRKGYVELLTGFRCGGLMGKNDALNYPIQGAAFHCLLWSLIRLNRKLREEKLRSCIIGQIHDSIILDLFPEEKVKLFPIIRKIMTVDIRLEYSWLIVPLEIDADISTIDGNWYCMENIKI